MTLRRTAFGLLLATSLALPSCGKKPSSLEHPESVNATYPRTYPAPR